MKAPIERIPFLRLLLPLMTGIVAGEFLPGVVRAALPLAAAGFLFIFSSFLLRPSAYYNYRWISGAGICLLLFSLSLHQMEQHNQSTLLTPPGYGNYELGTVLEIPEIKAHSIAVNIKTAPPGEKKIILYLAPTDEAINLNPGDEIVFLSQLTPFRNYGNPDDFDYAKFMKHKGFSGSGYVASENWQKTGRQHTNLQIRAQRFRKKALEFYHSFDLNDDAYAFICALTLGYKEYLTNEIQDAFRTSGTAHVLALSGLHVGIIYGVISLLFSFLSRSGIGFVIRRLLIIVTLWSFAFVAGMSPSIIRAAIMLTLFSFGSLFHRKGFSYNSLAAAAFFILLYKPASLFDVGFQMSFASVFAILYFHPLLSSIYHPTHKVLSYLWGLLSITLAAQLGVFPLVLFYFGTFPTWFFITNILVVPMIGIIIYTTLPLIALGMLKSFDFAIITTIHNMFKWIEKTLIELLLKIVYFAESMPFAEIADRKISFLQLVLLFIVIYSSAVFILSHRARPLITILSALLIFEFSMTYKSITEMPPQLTIFNSPGSSEIGIYHNNKRHLIDISENKLVPHSEKRILYLSETNYSDSVTEKQFPLDILILSKKSFFDIEQLADLFCPSVIVLDSSIPRYTALSIKERCQILGIEVHDVTEHGAFSLFF